MFQPISINSTQHRISLYADDILLYISDPNKCINGILDIFEKYGGISGFKINWQKSSLLPLNVELNSAGIPDIVPAVKHFTYLGVEIYPSITEIVKLNYDRTLTNITKDLERWSRIKNSLRSRVSVIKMNVLPRVNFVSCMIPLSPPHQYWDKLQSAVSKYIWNGKRPRLKLCTLQRDRKEGGLSLPNFKLYNWAFTLRPLTDWFRTDSQVSWRELEESLVSPNPLENFLGVYRRPISRRVHGSIVVRLVEVWEKAGKLCGDLFPWDPGIPLFGNQRLQINKKPIQFTAWEERGVSVLGDIFGEHGLMSFEELCTKYNLPRTTFYFYLQLRSMLRDLGAPLRSPLSEFPLVKILTSSSFKKFVSRTYKILLSSSLQPLGLNSVWRADFGHIPIDLDWDGVWENVGLSSRSPDHQQIHYNYIHRLYLTPKKLHAMKIIADPLCKLCSLNEVGTFQHMYWECPPVRDFWRQVSHKLTVLFEVTVPYSPATLLLNDLSQVKLKVARQRILLSGLTAAKKMVAIRWKPPHCLSIQAWTLMLLDIAQLETSIARMHKAKSETIELWQIFTDRLRRLCG